MERIEAVARRSGGWWAIEVPAHPGVFSQARRIDQVPAMAADALTAWLEQEISADLIDVRPVAEGELGEVFASATEARRHAEEARASAQEMTRRAVAQGIDAGLPLRDIGSLLGLTHQRVAAIARDMHLASV